MNQGPETYRDEHPSKVGKKAGGAKRSVSTNPGGQNQGKSISSSPKKTSTSADPQTTTDSYRGK